MTEIVLVRNGKRLSEPQIAAMMPALYGIVDGLSQTDKAAWRRFWKRVTKLEEGEVFSVETWAPRVGAYHRRHMLIESRVFQAQERIASFSDFRAWLKMGAGFCTWLPGPRGGGVIPIPKSISYKKCDEDTMRQFHEDAIAFLRTPHALKVLWPHLSPEQGEETIERLLAEFEE